MSETHNIPAATGRALRYLAGQQLPDGGFASHSSSSQVPFVKKHTYNTVFTPAIMLSALIGLEEAAAVKIRERLAAWLLGQKGPDWSFNYWALDAPERTAHPYPDDLDDTFCAAIGLHLYDESLLGGGALAHIVKTLIATETEAGGPYRTWLVPKTAEEVWLDTDLAVNANIAYFLTLVSNPLPNLDRLFEQAIATKQYSSPYYPSEYPVLYYLARAYKGPKQAALRKHIMGLQQADGSWGTPLQTALMVSALCRQSCTELDGAKAYLLDSQQADGSWKAEAFCLDPAKDKRQFYSGAPSLTTALVLEALHSLQAAEKDNAARLQRPKDKRAAYIYKTVVATARNRFRSAGVEVSEGALAVLDRLLSNGHGDSIILLPYGFYQSLRQRSVLDDQLFISLGLANLYGWLAYTIYDDFLDDEGKPELLGAANMAMRSSLREFELALPHNQAFQALVHQTFNTMDRANTWEVQHCRFNVDGQVMRIGKLPDFADLERLAERSLGHSLPLLAILLASGEPPDSPAAQTCLQAMRHYLIARQLNDDLHDWEADVAKGHITYVVSEVLRDLRLRSKQQDMRRLLGVMRQLFWHLSLPRLSQTITGHIEQGRAALADHPLLMSPNILNTLLNSVENVNNETLATVQQAEDFLKSYRTNK